MATFVIVRSEPAREGPQPFDPGRHMGQVADLVAQVFADELDARGRGALREMQLAGRLSPVLGGMLSMALFNETIYGQVWVEAGRVIGNVTLQTANQSGSRWRISNVAVTATHRGRGIARALMQAALREIAQRGGNWALLQVRAENQIAYRLYRSLGFEDVFRGGFWRLSTPPYQPPALPPGIAFEPLRTLTGGEWLTLARAARSSLAQWAEPIQAADYEIGLGRWLGEALGRLTGLYRVTRWAAWRNRRLEGAVETRANPLGGFDTLRFAVHPEARGALEAALVAQGLRALARPDAQPVIAEHDGGHAEGVAALGAAGFQIERDLITMRRAIAPADARL